MAGLPARVSDNLSCIVCKMSASVCPFLICPSGFIKRFQKSLEDKTVSIYSNSMSCKIRLHDPKETASCLCQDLRT